MFIAECIIPKVGLQREAILRNRFGVRVGDAKYIELG